MNEDQFKKKNGGFFRTLFRGINRLRLIIINVVFFFFFFSVLGVIGSVQPEKKAPAQITDDSALYINPSGIIVEQKEDNFTWLSSVLNKSTAIRLGDITKAIKNAAFDRRISTLYMDFSGADGLSSGHLTELAAALEQFKAAGKKIIAYSVDYGIPSYFAASYADTIGLDPLGDVSFSGFASRPVFYKGMEEKFGMRWNVLQAGDYKGLAETYSRDSLSQNVRSNLKTMFDSLWNRYAADISKNRAVPVSVIKDFAEKNGAVIKKYGGNGAEAALKEGLVTDVAVEEDFSEKYVLSQIGGNLIGYEQYNAAFAEALSGDSVALIYVSGAIASSANAGGESSASSGDIVDLFDLAMEDPEVKAIVLRIDSGGGEVFASEEIRRAVLRAKKSQIPVVVSMGSVAASGAYWISSAADYIFASPYTVTGSIGVLAAAPSFQTALKRHLGITSELVYSGQKPYSSFYEDPTEEEIQVRRLEILHTYKTFIETVSQGRNIPFDAVANLAGGRVYSGEQAVTLKLADALGSLDDAAAYAAELAELTGGYSVKEIKKPLTFKETIIKSMFEKADFSVLSALNISDLRAIRELLSLRSKKGIYVYDPERLIWGN